MPLPDDFNAYEHLLNQLIALHNRQVQQSFLGVEANDINSSLGAMRTAVFITEDDTIDMIILRIFLYHFKFRMDLPAPVFSTPNNWDGEITHKPQVTLTFREKNTPFLKENKLRRASAEISYRLKNQTNETINNAEAHIVALRIFRLLGEGNGFSWMKGKIKVSYRDLPNGICLILAVQSQAEGIRVIERILEVASVPFNEEHLSISGKPLAAELYPELPPMKRVYGREVRAPRRRPIAEVFFEKAELHVSGLPNAILLVDKSKRGFALVG